MTLPTDSARIQVRAYPNAPKNEIRGYVEGVLRIRIAAPPVDGKANKELETFLSRLLNTSKSKVSVIKGQTSRNKLVAIEGFDTDSVIKLLVPEQNRLF